MSTNGAIRAEWCVDRLHPDPFVGETHFRAYDLPLIEHVSGSGVTAPHAACPPISVAMNLYHVHTMVANGTTWINDYRPVLETDKGCWLCPCHASVYEFIVNKNPYKYYIEDLSCAVEDIDMIEPGSIHGGTAALTVGGSEDFFIGKACTIH